MTSAMVSLKASFATSLKSLGDNPENLVSLGIYSVLITPAFFEGITVGRLLGLHDGVAEGIAAGCKDGVDVGDISGSLLGMDVGMILGIMDGLIEGFVVGLLIG